MKILLADDHDLVRDTIAAFLESEEGTTVCTVASLEEALERIASEEAFDLVLLDFSMPGMNGLEGFARARDASAGKPVGLISGTAKRAVAEEALANGAAGFLPKTMSAKSLINAVRFMAAGEVFAPVAFLAQKDEDPEHELYQKLSSREREVLQGLMEGLANKEIARNLGLQEVTVKLHVKTLCRKMDAKNRTQAAMKAKDVGFA